MPCTGTPLTAPNISCLNFNLHWDLSGATPIVTITNASTVTNYAKLKWWFYVVSPNGAAVYGVDLSTVSPLPTPDVSGVSWSNKVITLPTPFGNPPCGQVEFSPTNPYTVYVYVQDIDVSTTSYFTSNKETLIVRPGGNNRNSCGNFGSAAVSMQVDCLNKNIMVFDGTNLMYNNILTPLSTSNKWTLVYPEDASGNPTNVVVNNQTNVNFPTSVNSAGYVLYFNEYATYDYGNGITVTVQYKLYQKASQIDQALGQQFAINCNTNLCLLQCQMQKFYQLSKGSCGTLENAELINKMTQMSFIFNQILTGIFQPLCGIDIPKLMAEIKAIGNFDDNCDCNCGSGNWGFSNPTGGGSSSGSCCPIYTSVVDTTGNPPANCPNGYFPATVYDPTGVTVIGTALSMPDEIAIINANTSWQAYGTAFDAGNCKVGFFPATGVTVIPNVKVNPSGGGTGGGTVIVNVVDPAGYPPVNCPAGYFPAQVYDPTGAIIIGVASDAASMVGIINANAAWQAIGTGYVVDNCHVGFNPKPGVTTFPPVVVTYNGGVNTGCVSGQQLYPVTITDICYPKGAPIVASSFPLNVYADFGLGAGPVLAGNASSQADMVSLLNAMSSKPATITFSAGATVDQLIISNSDCNAFSGVISVNANVASDAFLLFGGNHVDLLATLNDGESNEFAFSVKDLSILGVIGVAPKPWHTIKIGNVLLAADGSLGLVYAWDITNPLLPSFIRIIHLNAIVPACFTGVPNSATIASDALSPPTTVDSEYSLYFPTDYYAGMSLNSVFVVEAVTGCIWKFDVYDLSGGVLDGFQDDRLIGKCPRIYGSIPTGTGIVFTQDGNLESATGQSSGVAVGDIVVLNVATFSGAGISTKTVFLNHVENVWAASFDGSGFVYFTGEKTSIAKSDVATFTTVRYLYTAGLGRQMEYRANSAYFQGKLYVTPQHLPGFNGMIIDLSTLAGPVTITQFQQPTGSTINGLFNFLPLGNCLGIMTSAAIPGGSPAYVAIYRIDGTYLAHIPLQTLEEFYNVIAIPNISVTTPNSYLPAP